MGSVYRINNIINFSDDESVNNVINFVPIFADVILGFSLPPGVGW